MNSSDTDFRGLGGALIAVALLWLSAPDLAVGQTYMSGTRPQSMGGAYTSIATGPSGLYHNPAGVPMARMYAVAGTYQFHPSGSVLNASIADSRTNPKITAGAGYSYLLRHGDDSTPTGHDIRLAVAVPAIEQRFAVGIGGRYLALKSEGTGYARGFTLDGGVIVRITESFHVGVAGQNLLNVCNRPVRCRGVAPRTVTAGASYGRATAFQVAGDFGIDFNSEADSLNFEYELGGEYLIAGTVPVRLGYRHETLDTSHHVTGGVGWRSKKYGADLSADFNVTEISDFTAAASVAIYFN